MTYVDAPGVLKIKQFVLEVSKFGIGDYAGIVNLGKKFDLLLEQIHVSVDGRGDVSNDLILGSIIFSLGLKSAFNSDLVKRHSGDLIGIAGDSRDDLSLFDIEFAC